VLMNSSQQKVLDAASQLFFHKGFHGTSVRDIADKANVNVSLISYYFKGKQGLLEYAITNYYEAYLETIEEALVTNEQASEKDILKHMVRRIIEYKQEHYQMSCFIHRELSLDSIFVREMAVTYLAKENHFIKNTLKAMLKDHKQSRMDQEFLYMHLKGMLITPYVLHNEWKNHFVGDASHDHFKRKYVETIHRWIDFIEKEPQKELAIQVNIQDER